MKFIDIIELDSLKLLENVIIIDELDVSTGWSITGAGATVGLDTVNFRSGGAGLKMTVPANIVAAATKTLGASLNLGGFGPVDQIRFWVYVDDVTRLSGMNIQLTDTAGSPVTATYVIPSAVNGWNRYSISKTSFTNNGTINWTSILIVKFNITATAGGTVNVTWDMLRMMLGPTPTYTMGTWTETGLADVVDNCLKFFDAGVWTYNNANITLDTLWRIVSPTVASTVTPTVGSITIGGLNSCFKTLEIFNSDYVGKNRLIFFQPEYYRDSSIMNSIRTAQGYQLERGAGQILALQRQTLPDTASYQLVRHEREMGVGLADSSTLSWNKRRIRVKAQYVTARLPKNVAGMLQIILGFVKAAVVSQNPKTYTFSVQVTDPKGTPPNLGEIQAAIEQAKPAHLGYSITYTFTTWNQMDAYNRTWNVAELFTWNGFEVS